MESLLRDAWDKEGSPFKGQPFDPSVLSNLPQWPIPAFRLEQIWDSNPGPADPVWINIFATNLKAVLFLFGRYIRMNWILLKSSQLLGELFF